MPRGSSTRDRLCPRTIIATRTTHPPHWQRFPPPLDSTPALTASAASTTAPCDPTWYPRSGGDTSGGPPGTRGSAISIHRWLCEDPADGSRHHADTAPFSCTATRTHGTSRDTSPGRNMSFTTGDAPWNESWLPSPLDAPCRSTYVLELRVPSTTPPNSPLPNAARRSLDAVR